MGEYGFGEWEVPKVTGRSVWGVPVNVIAYGGPWRVPSLKVPISMMIAFDDGGFF